MCWFLSPISTPTQTNKLKPYNLNNFITRTSSYEKDSLDKQVARLFFSSNLSFNSVEGAGLKEYPAVLTNRCSAHYMSLLEKDIGNNIILKQIIEIQKYFRNFHLVHGLLKEKGDACHSCPMRHVGTRRLHVKVPTSETTTFIPRSGEKT